MGNKICCEETMIREGQLDKVDPKIIEKTIIDIKHPEQKPIIDLKHPEQKPIIDLKHPEP